MLEDALNLLKLRARVVMCGMLAAYNDLGSTLALPPGPNNLLNLAFKRARMEGFVSLDYWPRASEAFDALARWHGEGKLRYRAHVVEGLREAPRAMNKLFDGSNKGKLMLAV
jgi:NADPH-dependent curcumin reductase CurA